MGIIVGMIGLTHPHSAMHLRTLDALDAVDAVALYDSDLVTAGQTIGGCRKKSDVYSDLDALLERRDVPVVFVALPNHQTPEAVIRAAQAGKHVICEKPCAPDTTAMQPVLEAIERHGVGFTACYIWRAHPAILKMRDLVESGTLGRLTSVELRMVTTQVGMRNPAHWLFRRDVAGGGILSWLGCHWIDLLRFVTGQEVASLCALTGTVSGEPIDVEDVANVSMRLSGGAIASLHAGYLLAFGRVGYDSAGYDQAVIIRGSDGAMSLLRSGDDYVVSVESVSAAWRSAPRQAFSFSLPSSPAYGGVHGLEFVEDFIHYAMRGEGTNRVTAQDAYRVLQILDAIYASADRECVVRVGGSESGGRRSPRS